jgi:branched-chain amino acid transport system ATP-binding protein
MEAILTADGLNTFYGKSHILFDVSFNVRPRETLCLMGRNGAGKSTTFKSLVMLVPPRSGRVFLKGQDITGMGTHTIARLGVGLVPEDRRIFGTLTVKENLELGASTGRKGIWNLDLVYQYFPILKEYASFPGSNLSGGEQQMLTIARTLMGNPEVLLLDEPTEGLSPLMVKILKDLILKLKEVETTILLSEQNAKFAMRVADRVMIIDKGHIRYKGNIDDFRENEYVQKVYLAL